MSDRAREGLIWEIHLQQVAASAAADGVQVASSCCSSSTASAAATNDDDAHRVELALNNKKFCCIKLSLLIVFL